MTSSVVGTFTGKPVCVANLSMLEESLCNSVVFLVLGESIENEERTSFVRLVFSRTPLAIELFGVGAELAFDELIELQASGLGRIPHVMTAVSDEMDLVEAIRSFLAGTFPSEERFEDWDSYQIAVAGNRPGVSEVEQAVAEALVEYE